MNNYDYLDLPEDPRIAALQQGAVVTADNAVVGAEAVSMAHGVVIIRNINMEGKPSVACQLESNYRMRCWHPDGKYYSWAACPDLYYPAGKIPVKEPECETIKVIVKPNKNHTGHIFISTCMDSFTEKINWNGPEQEVEIQVYKEDVR